MAPVTLRIPPACLLNPGPEAAVVGGNVLTSQRVTDVVLKAFRAQAASQGCMNNLTFGDEGMGWVRSADCNSKILICVLQIPCLSLAHVDGQ